MRAAARAGFLVAALAVVTACAGESGPTPGELTVRLTTPNADDGAMVLVLSGPGPITNVAAASAGTIVHARDASGSMRVAAFGSIASGDLIRFSVPDVEQASSYQATIHEVADRGNVLRPAVTSYTLAIVR
jgi:hypothetical protein